MKIIFTSLLLFVAFISAKAQTHNCDVFDFDAADTFYYYNWGSISSAELMDSRLIIDTVNYKRNEWQIGKPQKKIFNAAYSLPNAMLTDTNRACLPNDTSVFLLKLSNSAWPYGMPLYYLSFVYRLDIDSGDVAMVEASIDSCKTWTNILSDTNAEWHTPNKPDLSVSTAGWDSIFIFTKGILRVANDTIYLKFTFITGNDTNARDGWMIDHIAAYHPVEAVADVKGDNIFQLYPNPAISKAILKFTKPVIADCHVTAIDALGRQVYTDRIKKGSSEYSLAVRGWAKGVYFIEIDDGKGDKAVEQLMVE